MLKGSIISRETSPSAVRETLPESRKPTEIFSAADSGLLANFSRAGRISALRNIPVVV